MNNLFTNLFCNGCAECAVVVEFTGERVSSFIVLARFDVGPLVDDPKAFTAVDTVGSLSESEWVVGFAVQVVVVEFVAVC